MTPERANRINRAIFFTVVIYIIAVCVAVGLGDRGVMASAGQALVVVPFAIIVAIAGAVVLAYLAAVMLGLVSVALGLVGSVCMILCLIFGRKQAALQVSEYFDTFERKVAQAINPPKDQDG